MNKLSTEKRAEIIHALCEGNSVRATCRLTGCAKGTVLRLLVEVGTACSRYQDKVLRNLPCKRIELDEIWSFVGAKEKNTPRELRGRGKRGDVWTWTAIDADSKLAVSWLVGTRDYDAAKEFVDDLRDRLRYIASRSQPMAGGPTYGPSRTASAGATWTMRS